MAWERNGMAARHRGVSEESGVACEIIMKNISEEMKAAMSAKQRNGINVAYQKRHRKRQAASAYQYGINNISGISIASMAMRNGVSSAAAKWRKYHQHQMAISWHQRKRKHQRK
jgi:hypothetical protein